MACKTYVDDLRSIASTQSLVKESTKKMETAIGYIGLKDATRKRRPISQTTGECNGSINISLGGIDLFVTVS